jgi:uncharacterized protein (TIGR00251 family)
MLPLKETPNGVAFSIQVVPRSSRCEIVGIINDTLKIRLTAPPVEGKANEECLRFLSALFDVSKNRLSIVGGQTSRRKIIQVSGMGSTEMEGLLERILPVNRAPELFDAFTRKGKPV